MARIGGDQTDPVSKLCFGMWVFAPFTLHRTPSRRPEGSSAVSGSGDLPKLTIRDAASEPFPQAGQKPKTSCSFLWGKYRRLRCRSSEASEPRQQGVAIEARNQIHKFKPD